MKQLTIIYWSGTGNTKTIAEAIQESLNLKSGEVTIKVKTPKEASKEDVMESDILLLGSPAMGMEEIDSTEMAPFIQRLKQEFPGKKLALFGSYDWGDGQWMIDWESDMESLGGKLIGPSLIVCGAVTDKNQSEINQFVDRLMIN